MLTLDAILKTTRQMTSYGEGPQFQAKVSDKLCSDCPPADYPTDKTRCDDCPRRSA